MPEIPEQFNDYVRDEENFLLEYALRNLATPPIKGEITRGKIKWRGIRLCKQVFGVGLYHVWVEQKGKKISPTIIFNWDLNNNQ